MTETDCKGKNQKPFGRYCGVFLSIIVMRAWPVVSLGPDSEYPRFTGHPGFCHVKAARHRLNARRSPRSHDRQGAARGPLCADPSED